MSEVQSVELLPFFAIRRMVFDGSTIRLEAGGVAIDARCPECEAIGTRVHGQFVRRPSDLPWRGCTVRLVVTVRRFRCDRSTCPRLTFSEELGRLPRRARRTTDVTALLLWIVNAAGGEKGARPAIVPCNCRRFLDEAATSRDVAIAHDVLRSAADG